MKSRMSERLAEAIDACAPKNGKYAWLEEISGIATTSWKSALAGRQRPTAEMLECFCRNQPDVAFYVITGTVPQKELEHTDPKTKHLENMDIELSSLLRKEPIDWSNIELDFAILKLRKSNLQGIDPNVFDLAVQARIENKLLEDYLLEKEINFKKEMEEAFSYGEMNEMAKNGLLEDFKKDASILRDYRAKK